MSEKSRKQYTADLYLLSSQFTKQTSNPPSTITDFNDITLKDYHNDINCGDNTFNTPIAKSEKDNILFIDYADNLKEYRHNHHHNPKHLLPCFSNNDCIYVS
jgi:hypothetical protein